MNDYAFDYWNFIYIRGEYFCTTKVRENADFTKQFVLTLGVMQKN